MTIKSRLAISSGDVEIDLEGSAVEIDERIIEIQGQAEWSVLLDIIKTARDNAIQAAKDAAKDAGLPERGSAFRTLLDTCKVVKKPDQVLAAIHYLRTVEGVDDCPPRTILDLFEAAGVDKPGNLSLYMNRLRERGFLVTPPSAKEKNRYAILTPEGRAHLDKRSRY